MIGCSARRDAAVVGGWRHGIWWGRSEARIVEEGVDFAQDTQEGGGDDYIFIPDSDEEASKVQPDGSGDAFSFVPDSELQPDVPISVEVGCAVVAGAGQVCTAEETRSTVGGAGQVCSVMETGAQVDRAVDVGGTLVAGDLVEGSTEDGEAQYMDLGGYSQEDDYPPVHSGEQDDAPGDALEEWVMEFLVSMIPLYAHCLKRKRD